MVENVPQRETNRAREEASCFPGSRFDTCCRDGNPHALVEFPHPVSMIQAVSLSTAPDSSSLASLADLVSLPMRWPTQFKATKTRKSKHTKKGEKKNKESQKKRRYQRTAQLPPVFLKGAFVQGSMCVEFLLSSVWVEACVPSRRLLIEQLHLNGPESRGVRCFILLPEFLHCLCFFCSDIWVANKQFGLVFANPLGSWDSTTTFLKGESGTMACIPGKIPHPTLG